MNCWLYSQTMAENFKLGMMEIFEMTNLELLHYFLVLEVMQEKGGIFISQRNYAMNLLKSYNMLYCKSTATPMNIGEKFQ